MSQNASRAYADDSRKILELVVADHGTTGFRAREFVSSEEFLAVYDRLGLRSGIILLDLMLPGMDGASLVETLGRRGCWWPILILAGHPGAAEVERALGRCARCTT